MENLATQVMQEIICGINIEQAHIHSLKIIMALMCLETIAVWAWKTPITCNGLWTRPFASISLYLILWLTCLFRL